MRRTKILLLVILTLLTIFSILASAKKVVVKTPGTLAELTLEKQRAELSKLDLTNVELLMKGTEYDPDSVSAICNGLTEGGQVLADSIFSVLKNNVRKLGDYDNFAAVEAGDIYNVACWYSLAGDVKNALRFLELTYQVSPIAESYAHIMQDADLDNIRETDKFKEIARSVREATDYLYILRNCPPYEPGMEKEAPRISYAPVTDENLKRIKAYFNLDSIAGNGDEVSRIKNVMYWLHDAIRHDGQNGIPRVKLSAIELYEACKKENRGMNCRGLAIVLSELYMAMGYPARFVTCQSKAYDIDTDCHVICTVWSKQLNKWLWMDPSFAAYVSDEHGNLLSIAEVRERMRSSKPLVLNEDANWNHQQKQTKEYYLENYMAKNLYYLSCYLNNGANTEGNSMYVTLQPKGCSARICDNTTSDDRWFWQAPMLFDESKYKQRLK